LKPEEHYRPEQIVGEATRKGIECIYQFVWEDKKRGGKLRYMRT